MPNQHFDGVQCLFPDGVLDYNCRECDAICCRGKGFGVNASTELPQLVSLYPALKYQIKGRHGDLVSLHNISSGCAMLGPDRMCVIQRDHGWSLKPMVCRLFPFNSFSRIGATLLVSPHFMCPLRLRVPPEPDRVAGNHASVVREVKAAGILNADIAGYHEPRLPPDMAVAEVLARELRFADLCASNIGMTSFESMLLSQEEHPGTLDIATRKISSLLELAEGGSDGRFSTSVDNLLMAIAPSFRLRVLNFRAEEITLLLSVAHIVVRRLLTEESRMPSLQDVAKMLVDFEPLLMVFGAANRIDLLRHIEGLPSWPVGFPHHFKSAYCAFLKLNERTTVIEALEGSFGSMDAAARVEFIRFLGGLVHAKQPPQRLPWWRARYVRFAAAAGAKLHTWQSLIDNRREREKVNELNRHAKQLR